MISEEEIISEILKHELEITNAVMKGFKPHNEDVYQEKRERVKYLRELLIKLKDDSK